jgi:hypothetical protein
MTTPTTPAPKATINRSEPHNLKNRRAPNRALPYPKNVSPSSVWFFTAGDAAGHVTFRQFRQIESGREMVAVAMEDDGTYVLGKTGECSLQAQDRLIVEGISLFRTGQANEYDTSRPLDRD